MVLCFVAVFVYAFLGLFSAKYRKNAQEALNCIIRTATLRPCETDLDTRLKASILGFFGKYSVGLASFTGRNFELISRIFVVLFFAANIYLLYQFGLGLYNYSLYQNCNGPDSTEFCPLNPGATGAGGHSIIRAPDQLVVPPLVAGPYLGNPAAKVTVVEFGCFSCPYTKLAVSTVDKLLSDYNGSIKVQWRFFPLPDHPYSKEGANAAACAYQQGKFSDYFHYLFKSQRNNTHENILSYASQAGLNMTSFTQCYNTMNMSWIVNRDLAAGNDSGIYGTPTFFIGNTSIVGPQPYDTFKAAIDSQLARGGN